MTQRELNFTPFPSNPFNPGTQVYALYERLRVAGEISTREIHHQGFETARIRSDIRPFLRRNGLDYRCIFTEDRSNRIYRVVKHANS